MISLFILEDWWGEQSCRVAVGELGKIFLILSHEIYDVTKTLNVQHISLQHVHDNGTQLLNYSQMQTVSQ